jgi:Lon protease-like protein
MDDCLEIPIFPLTQVLFPAGRLPLRIFEPRYVEMTRACLRDNAAFGVCLIQAGFEVGKPAIPCEIGCTARILEWHMPAPDQYRLLAQGESPFRILRRWTLPDGLIRARVQLLEPSDPVPVPERHALLARLLTELIDQLGQAYFPTPRRLDDAAWVGNRLCELMPIKPERRQKLLEIKDPLVVLDELQGLLRELREEGE